MPAPAPEGLRPGGKAGFWCARSGWRLKAPGHSLLRSRFSLNVGICHEGPGKQPDRPRQLRRSGSERACAGLPAHGSEPPVAGGELRCPAFAQRHCRARRPHAVPFPAYVFPLGGLEPEEIRPVLEPRACQAAPGCFGKRSRCGLQRRTLRRRPITRSVCHPGGGDSRGVQASRRGSGDPLRLPSFALRRMPDTDYGSRHLRPRFRHQRRPGRDARRFAQGFRQRDANRGL